MLSFDTGSTLPIPTEIGNGVVELLQPLLLVEGAAATPRGPYLRTVRQSPWDLDDEVLDERLLEVLGALPAAVVVVGDGEVITQGPTLLRWRHDIRVHIVSGYAGDWVEGRLDPVERDPREDPGIRAIGQHVVEALHFQALATTPESGPIHTRGNGHGATTPSWSWWVLFFDVEVQQAVCRDRTAPLVDELQANQDVNGADDIVTSKRIF